MKSGHTLEQSAFRREGPGNMENNPRNDEAHRFMLGMTSEKEKS